jgi:O-antigen/teichoic acid export membrane protein
MTVGAAVPQASFRGVVMRGLAWKTATRVLLESSRLVVAIVVARLLTPDEYGIAGMVLVLVAFEPVLAGNAVSSVLVRARELDEDTRSTVFWTCVAIGACTSAAGVALSWPAAAFYGRPAVQPLFAVTSLIFFVSSLGQAQSTLLVRNLNFRALELRTMVGTLGGAGLAIGLALAGFGPWALVAQPLGAMCLSTALLWTFNSWRPQLRFSRHSFRAIRSFGRDVSGTFLLFQLNQNTDNVLVGRFLGAAPLGAYALAYNVILVPFSRLASPLHDVLYPIFSRLQDDRARMRSVWLRTMRLLAAVAIPAMLGLVVVAPDLVDVVFGEKWHDAAPVMRILAWVGALYVVQGLNSVLLQAIGRTQLLVRYAVVSFAVGLGSFLLGLHWGIVGVAGCFAAAMTVIGPVYMTLTARAVGASGRDVLHALAVVVRVGLVAAAAAGGLRLLLVDAGASEAVRLAAVVAAGIAVYAACVALTPALRADVAAAARRR